MDFDSVKGKTVIVTGASRGIGKAIAAVFGEHGMKVVCAARSQEQGQAVADALASMMLGGFEDRRRYNIALAAIDDLEKKARFIDEWQDGRSSLNDIGGEAHKLATSLKKRRAAQT